MENLIELYFINTESRNKKQWQARIVDGDNTLIYVLSKKSTEPENICDRKHISKRYLCRVKNQPVFKSPDGNFKIFEVTLIIKRHERGEILTRTFSYNEYFKKWQSFQISQFLSKKDGELETIYVPDRNGISPAEDTSAKPEWTVRTLGSIFRSDDKEVIAVELIKEHVSKRSLARRVRNGRGNTEKCVVV